MTSNVTIRCMVCRGHMCRVNEGRMCMTSAKITYENLVQSCEICGFSHYPNKLPTFEQVLGKVQTRLTFSSNEYDKRRKTWIMCAYVTPSINVLGKRLILTLWEMGSRGCEHGCGRQSRLPCCMCSDNRLDAQLYSPKFPDGRSNFYCEECKVQYQNLPVHIQERRLDETRWRW